MNLRRHIPNALSLLRILIVPCLVPLFEQGHGLLLITLLLLAQLSDAADGYLARRWEVSSRCGAWLDAVADKLLVWDLLYLLWMQKAAPLWFISTLLLRDLLLFVLGLLILRAASWQQMRPSLIGKLSMALQMLVLLILILRLLGLGAWLPGLSALMASVVLLSLLSLLLYSRRLWQLRKVRV